MTDGNLCIQVGNYCNCCFSNNSTTQRTVSLYPQQPLTGLVLLSVLVPHWWTPPASCLQPLSLRNATGSSSQGAAVPSGENLVSSRSGTCCHHPPHSSHWVNDTILKAIWEFVKESQRWGWERDREREGEGERERERGRQIGERKRERKGQRMFSFCMYYM